MVEREGCFIGMRVRRKSLLLRLGLILGILGNKCVSLIIRVESKTFESTLINIDV